MIWKSINVARFDDVDENEVQSKYRTLGMPFCVYVAIYRVQSLGFCPSFGPHMAAVVRGVHTPRVSVSVLSDAVTFFYANSRLIEL